MTAHSSATLTSVKPRRKLGGHAGSVSMRTRPPARASIRNSWFSNKAMPTSGVVSAASTNTANLTVPDKLGIVDIEGNLASIRQSGTALVLAGQAELPHPVRRQGEKLAVTGVNDSFDGTRPSSRPLDVEGQGRFESCVDTAFDHSEPRSGRPPRLIKVR